MEETAFLEFPKMPRFSRDMIITEKIDGTNSQILFTDHGDMLVGSRQRWITPGKETDNYGFARWCHENRAELEKLGPGRHFGEWWGNGIQRGYAMKEKVFSLFNVSRWSDDNIRPACCRVIPVLHEGPFNSEIVDNTILELHAHGSYAAPGFMNPEGIVVWHTAGNCGFKKTIKHDELPKSMVK